MLVMFIIYSPRNIVRSAYFSSSPYNLITTKFVCLFFKFSNSDQSIRTIYLLLFFNTLAMVMIFHRDFLCKVKIEQVWI